VNYNSVTLGGDTYNTTTKTGGTVIHNVARYQRRRRGER
jgi:hypothetical protein